MASDGVEITGPKGDRYDEVLTPEALGLRRRAAPGAWRAARGAAGRPRERGSRSSPPAGRWTSCRDASDPRRPVLAGRRRRRRAWWTAGSRSPARPSGRCDQRAELRRQGVPGRLRGREHPDLGQHGRRPAQPDRRASSAASTSPPRRASRTGCAGPDVATMMARARAAGTCPRSTCWSTARRRRARSSTSGCTSSTTPRRQLLDRGSRPYFYLPKMESHLEARLWNDVFLFAQDCLGVARGTIRATVLIETHPGRVRDGGDPLRAAGALLRAERGPLGLHVLRDQDVPRRAAGSSCCPTATR